MSAPPEETAEAARKARPLRFAVIGAGMSGLLAAIQLREAGYEDVVVYEKAGRVGGTWRENTYPGISCDVPSHLYAYSFALNPEWSRRFSPGSEIQAYFEGVAARYELEACLEFGREVTRCAFEGGRWQLEFADGHRSAADFVIAATGVLHHPVVPDVEGADTFAGAAFHSARWDHDVSIAGRRVGVVGTGSSATQIVAAIAGEVASLALFQRTAQWITPIENPEYSADDKAEFRRDPEAMRAIREQASRAFTDGFANHLSNVDSPVLQLIQDTCVANLENSVRDPELRERLRPDYRATCKRLVLSDGFYPAIQRDNVELVTDAIERIEPAGVHTEDGRLHELDVLVWATGFAVQNFVRPMRVYGRGGTSLDDAWSDAPHAYMATSVADFPNFFFLQGPSGPVGNFSLIEVAELQMAYVLQLAEEVRAGRCAEISVSHEALERYERERAEAARKTIWATGCNSWYLDARGIPMAWPWTFDRFREEMRAPRLADYERLPHGGTEAA